MHTECVRLEPTVTHHLGRNEQNLENPILISRCCYFKVVYASLRLHRSKCHCLWTFLLILTKSFLPGINLVYSSFSKKSYTMSVIVIDSVFSLNSVLAKMPFWILTSHALSSRYSETSKKFAAKFLISVSKSEFWFYNQKKVAYLLSAPLNHQGLSLSFYFLFVYQIVLCSQSCTNLQFQ